MERDVREMERDVREMSARWSEMYARCQRDVCEMPTRCQRDVREMYVRWSEMSTRCQRDVREMYVRWSEMLEQIMSHHNLISYLCQNWLGFLGSEINGGLKYKTNINSCMVYISASLNLFC